MVVLLTLLAVSSGATASLLNTDGINEPGARISEAPKVPAPIQALAGLDVVDSDPKAGIMGVSPDTPLVPVPNVASDSKHVIVEAAALPPTGAGCYPLFNNQYTYIEKARASLPKSNANIYLSSSGVWKAYYSCDSSLSPACYDNAFDGKATYNVDGTQVNYLGHNFILFKGGWQDLGACTTYTAFGTFLIDYLVGVAPDHTIWRKGPFDSSERWQSVSGSVRALDMVQLPDLSFVVIGTDYQLYACPGLSMWFQCTLVPNSGYVKSIDASPYGTNFIGVGMDNLVYLRSGLYGSWTRIQTAGEVVDVTILLDESILGTAPDGTLWTLNSPSAPWVKVPNGCCVIRTSVTRAGIIIGVGPDKKLYQKVNLQAPWVLVPDSGSVISVSYYKSLPRVNILLGIAADNSLWGKRAESLTGPWQQIPTNVKAIDIIEYSNEFLVVAPDYTVMVCSTLYDLRGCQQEPNSGSVKSIGFDTTTYTLVGVGLDNQLYKFQDNGWVLVPNSGSVFDIEIRSGTIYGVGTDYNVYTKASLTAPWKLNNYCCVSSLASLPNGRLGGVGLDNAVYDANGNWNLIPNSKSVVNIANITTI